MSSPSVTGPLNFSDWLAARGNERQSGFLAVGEIWRTETAHLSTMSYLVSKGRLAAQLAAQRSAVSSSDVVREIVDAFLDGRAYGKPTTGENQEAEAETASRFDADNPVGTGKRPFIVETFHHGYRPNEIDFVQAFKLFWNGWWDGNILRRLDNDGAVHDVARVTRNAKSVRLEVDFHHLRSFLALANAGLLRIHDHMRYSDDPTASDSTNTHIDGSGVFESHVGHNDFLASYASFGRVMGKDVVAPYEGLTSDPRESIQGHERFIVGRDPDGTDRVASADESAGEAPFLTAVYFRPEVLRRYYDAPDRYTVQTGTVTCLDFWSIPFERRPSDDLVQVYLGDLGNTPHVDQRHWRSFNVQPPGTGISDVRFRRDFNAEWVNPEGDVVFDFKLALIALNKSANDILGSPIFQDLTLPDRHVFENLRVPVSDGPEESDNQITGLAKITVDSFDNDLIKRNLPVGTDTTNLRSIVLLQKVLEGWGVTDTAVMIEPFGALYAVRSTGAAHRRGSGAEKALQRAGLLELGNKELVRELTRRLTDAMLRIQHQIEQRRSKTA